jgi:hypothetical protein
MAKITTPLPTGIQNLWKGMHVRHQRSGHKYTVLCVARVEKTLEVVVVYRSDDAEDEIWTRPHGEFCDGRFAVIG